MRSHRFPLGARVRVGDAHAKAANTLRFFAAVQRLALFERPRKNPCLVECGDGARQCGVTAFHLSRGSMSETPTRKRRIRYASSRAVQTLALFERPRKSPRVMECGDGARSAESPLSNWSAGPNWRRSRESGECANASSRAVQTLALFERSRKSPRLM